MAKYQPFAITLHSLQRILCKIVQNTGFYVKYISLLFWAVGTYVQPNRSIDYISAYYFDYKYSFSSIPDILTNSIS